LREFEATVQDAVPDGDRVRVYLDRTAFYPDSGGQPSDRGSLSGTVVLELVDEDEAIAHILERRPETDRVKGQIDWTHRFDHMQQHTGQHILSAAFEKAGGYKTVSFHLGSENSTIDLDSDRLGRRQLDEAEDAANRIIFENREVRILFKSSEEANAMGLRKATAREGEVRLIEVPGFDLSACGGTHVSRTGAVGLILVRKFERLKGLTRVEFVCGGRGLKAARADFAVLTDSAKLFSGAPENLPTLITKHSEELRGAVRVREKLVKRLSELEAKDLWAASPKVNGRRIIRRIYAAGETEEARALAHALARQPGTVALVGVEGKPAMLFFAQTPGGAADMGSLLRQTLAQVDGKGGGSRSFAQGGGFEESRLNEALDIAASLV
jgi:alanyl-tRNA synthetase